MTNTVKAIIDGIEVEVPEGTTIQDAASKVNIKVPVLCKHPDLCATAACGICVVRVKGAPNLTRSCCTPLANGMDITTIDPDIVKTRRTVLELILSNHPNECLTCIRNGNCELQALAADFGIRQEPFPSLVKPCEELPKDDSTKSIVLDPRKCITCGRCVEVCQNIQDVWALSFLKRGINTRIAPAGDVKLGDSPCIRCGQCAVHCPTGAISEYDQTQKVWEALMDREKICIVQIAPAVRVAVGEEFGLEPGTNMTGKLYAGLRRLGFKTVFDTNFGADLTIIEESAEFVNRFVNGSAPLPLITTCCPAWVDFLEKYHADMIPHFSSCKSPHQMVGAVAKTFYAEKMGLDPAKIFVVSIMPCTAKKYEVGRNKDMQASGYQDVDVTLTTRELARMFNQGGVDFVNLPDEEADSPLGEYTGAGTIFGATGGVMEAALRTAYWRITGKEPDDVEFHDIRPLDGIKEMKLNIEGKEIRIAVAHGTGNVERLMQRVKESKEAGGEPLYHFIEVMACPGGCVGGGGQPRGHITNEIRKKRAAGLYQDDRQSKYRCSHQNPSIQKLYKDFLGEALGEKAHKLLHTHYTPRPTYRRGPSTGDTPTGEE